MSSIQKYKTKIFALILLVFLGGKMIVEEVAAGSAKEKGKEEAVRDLHGAELLAQGVATSIDALSVGFAIESYDWREALTASVIIGAVTLAICLGGLRLGRSLGARLAGKAGIVGGIILIAIGLEIFLTR